MRRAILTLLTALCSSLALASSDVNKAEHERLSDELERLASRQVWPGVERKFQELEGLEVELTTDDYLYGAYAARELGDVGAAYERLQAAAREGGSKEIVDWLWDIDHNYGHVELLMVPTRPAELTANEMPFDPNQRKAVEAAIRSTKADGIFVGMLPRGSYDFAGQPFTVDPGVSVRIEVSPKVRKHGPIDPVIRYPDGKGPPPAPSTLEGAREVIEPDWDEPPPVDPDAPTGNPEGEPAPEE